METPTEAERQTVLLGEIRDLLLEIRAALKPPGQVECPECGSAYVTRSRHLRDIACSRGACLRWRQNNASSGWAPHSLCVCGDCDHEWVEDDA